MADDPLTDTSPWAFVPQRLVLGYDGSRRQDSVATVIADVLDDDSLKITYWFDTLRHVHTGGFDLLSLKVWAETSIARMRLDRVIKQWADELYPLRYLGPIYSWPNAWVDGVLNDYYPDQPPTPGYTIASINQMRWGGVPQFPRNYR